MSKAKQSLAQFKKAVSKHSIRWEKVQAGMIWKPEKQGESCEGLLVARNVIDTKFGLAPQVELRDGDQSYLLLTSKAGLKVLNRVPLETPCRVTYTGTQSVKGRKTLMDTFNVEIAAGTKLEEDWAVEYYKKEKGSKRKPARRDDKHASGNRAARR